MPGGLDGGNGVDGQLEPCMPVEGYGVVDYSACERDVLTVANWEQVHRAGRGSGVQQSQEAYRGQQGGRYRPMQKPEQKPNRRTG